jgi:excisionase family DNA binding protein
MILTMRAHTTEPKYLDIDSAAAHLGMTSRAVRARVGRGQLPFRRLGGRIIIPRDELERYIRALDGVSASEAAEALARVVGSSKG